MFSFMVTKESKRKKDREQNHQRIKTGTREKQYIQHKQIWAKSRKGESTWQYIHKTQSKYHKHLMHMKTSVVQHTCSHLPAPWDWWAGQCFLEVRWVCYCWRWALAEEDHTHTLAGLTAGSGYSTAIFKQNTLQHLSECYSSSRNIYLENFILIDQWQCIY